MQAEVPPPPSISLILALGQTDEQLARLVRHVAALQAMTGSFTPVIVTTRWDIPELAGLSWPVEYVMPPDDWAKIQDPARWAAYAEERLREIVLAHAPDNVVVTIGDLGTEGIDADL